MTPLIFGGVGLAQTAIHPQIRFSMQPLPFRVETDETLANPHAPATMAGGAAVFDYNRDGRPDIFLTNGANMATLKKDAPKYSNRLFRNEGKSVFTDVTKQAGLAGTGYDMGAAVADYDNDGYPDLFVAGVHGRTLYHNNGDGTFTDVTKKAGLDNHPVMARTYVHLGCVYVTGLKDRQKGLQSFARAIEIVRPRPTQQTITVAQTDPVDALVGHHLLRIIDRRADLDDRSAHEIDVGDSQQGHSLQRALTTEEARNELVRRRPQERGLLSLALGHRFPHVRVRRRGPALGRGAPSVHLATRARHAEGASARGPGLGARARLRRGAQRH